MKPAMVKHYRGRLGDFDYNTADWDVRFVFGETGKIDALRYRGREVDGANIEIPEGVVDASYMFEGSYLMTPPKIPMSVKVGQYMFQNCRSLTRGAALPYGMERTAFMYQNCRLLVVGSDLPDTVINAAYMYDGCSSLQFPGSLSAQLLNVAGMFRDCRTMCVRPDLPDGVQRYDNVFKGCDFLNTAIGE